MLIELYLCGETLQTLRLLKLYRDRFNYRLLSGRRTFGLGDTSD